MREIKTVLVTGSSGTVGTALVERLLAEQYRVLPVDRRANIFNDDIDRRTIRRDLRYALTDLRLKSRPDLIVHLAANARVHDLVVRPQLALDNYAMTHHLLEYARRQGIKRVLFSSSREVYGESAGAAPRREADTHVAGVKAPYTASKFASEALIHAYRECYDLQPVIVRLSNVYGRYDVSERVVPLFMYYARRNRDLVVFGGGKRLDFTFIDDCIDGLTRIIKRFDRVQGETFNISRGKGERLVDLARMIVGLYQARSKITVAEKRTGEITSFVGDISLARRLLGYNPKVSLAEGLQHSVQWYEQAMRDRRAYESQRRNLARRGWL